MGPASQRLARPKKWDTQPSAARCSRSSPSGRPLPSVCTSWVLCPLSPAVCPRLPSPPKPHPQGLAQRGACKWLWKEWRDERECPSAPGRRSRSVLAAACPKRGQEKNQRPRDRKCAPGRSPRAGSERLPLPFPQRVGLTRANSQLVSENRVGLLACSHSLSLRRAGRVCRPLAPLRPVRALCPHPPCLPRNRQSRRREGR